MCQAVTKPGALQAPMVHPAASLVGDPSPRPMRRGRPLRGCHSGVLGAEQTGPAPARLSTGDPMLTLHVESAQTTRRRVGVHPSAAVIRRCAYSLTFRQCAISQCAPSWTKTVQASWLLHNV